MTNLAYDKTVHHRILSSNFTPMTNLAYDKAANQGILFSGMYELHLNCITTDVATQGLK